ncbi:small cell adhesion glycoprotein-like [Nerophis ophidion]|uniref:small cell adhesion glycoprotein-like n=1 Tax=Nerophis ophidion TaxID=159077 RepID=UPI002AE05C44|nr:small cell adhesion glycoprotein-like [Nerophis ophidion]
MNASTTPIPAVPDSTPTTSPLKVDTTVVAVVVTLILLTVVMLGFLLYRYMCHNKGDYRTTGEPAPGEDLDEDNRPQEAPAKRRSISSETARRWCCGDG